MLDDLIRTNRSYRRFYEDHAVESKVLDELVELARLSASAANRQPLKYILSAKRDINDLIFSRLAWAGYLKDWAGPSPGERPAAYIIILGDRELATAHGCDHGIAAQNIMLGAVERGLGGCIIASIKRDELRKDLAIPARYDILLALALGKPKEQVVIERVGDDGDIKYWRDDDARHHVPKRSREEVIVSRYE